MTIRSVPRAVTEAAIHYLHATYVDHRRSLAKLPAPHGRIVTAGSMLAAYDADAIGREACFFRMISVVEAYIDTIFSALFHERAPTTQDLVRRLVDGAEERGSSTWEERRKSFDRYHDVRLGQLSRWSDIDAGVQVRNAIAHGLGRLTARQRSASVVAKVRQIGVEVRDGSITISDASLERCRDACVDFIRDLDAATRTSTP